ncbi:MAG: ABC transporter ATP-binding protein [Planctomycetota bacterium]|nr:MAG: ABC transporter ATP-binding protein [Planctomycetota bacterium]
MSLSEAKDSGRQRKTVVTIEDLCKSYVLGHMELPVLKSLDLSFCEGEYVSIMGPSGSGKSTLLNILGCLDKPTGGRYLLGTDDVSTLDDNQLSAIRGKRIGFIFQSFNLIRQLNIVENIEVAMYYQHVPKHQRRQRATLLAERVGLGDRIRHRPFELSGGQQQRVAIARALANDPLIILADEPTGNLDSQSGAEILEILNELSAQGKTIIVVTHDEQIASQTHRSIHLLDGQIDRIQSNGTGV